MAVKGYRLSDDGLFFGGFAPGGLRETSALGGAGFGDAPFVTRIALAGRTFGAILAFPPPLTESLRGMPYLPNMR